MTKLMEWLFGVSLFVSIWIALLTRQVNTRLLDEWMYVIKPLPLIVVIMFGGAWVTSLNSGHTIENLVTSCYTPMAVVPKSNTHISPPFSLYSITVILWRVYNFNNCEDAAKELQMEIQEARDDLRKKGFVFDSDR